MKLYEINSQLERLLTLPDGAAVDQETGEVFSAEDIDALNIVRDEKIEACLLFCKNQDAEAVAIKAEIAALTERMRACEKASERCKLYVEGFLNGEKFATAKVKVTYRKSTVCQINIDPASLPEQFQTVKTTVTANKTELTKHIKAGGAVQGVELVAKVNMGYK